MDGDNSWVCPKCPEVFEFLDRDATSDGMGVQQAFDDREEHMETVHGFGPEERRRAVYEQIASQEPALSPELRADFVEFMMEEGREDE